MLERFLVPEQDRVFEGAVADHRFRVDGEPAALLEIEDIIMMQVGMERQGVPLCR